MPNLDLILCGRPNLTELQEAFKQGFDQEHQLVSAIKLHLVSPSDNRIIEQERSSIEDMLNGRVEGGAEWVSKMYERWNSFLGFRCFGS